MQMSYGEKAATMYFLSRYADSAQTVSLTVTVSVSNDLTIQLIALSGIGGFRYHNGTEYFWKSNNQSSDTFTLTRPDYPYLIWGCDSLYWWSSHTGKWSCNELGEPICVDEQSAPTLASFLDQMGRGTRTFKLPMPRQCVVIDCVEVIRLKNNRPLGFQNSFLSGVAVGRALNGVDVLVKPVSNLIEKWYFTSGTPTVGKIHFMPLNYSTIEDYENGAHFGSSGSNTLSVSSIPWCTALEIDVAQMQLSSGTHIFVSFGGSLRYQNGIWRIYTGSEFVDSTETDGSYFNACTVRIEVDKDRKWKVYKDGSLFMQTNVSVVKATDFKIGDSGYGLPNAIVSAVRLYVI